MFGLKRKKAAPAGDEDNDLDNVANKAAAPYPKLKLTEKDKGGGKEAEKGKEKDEDPAKSDEATAKGGWFKGQLSLILGFAVLTMIAGGAGSGAGMFFASSLEQTFLARQKSATEAEKTKPPVIIKYSGDRVLQKIEPVVTNLAAPPDTWIRLEAAIVFANGSIADPQATAAEIRQDILAYCRTLTIEQLQGPSALQHLREDLSERVSLRTNGAANELVIETMVVQ